MADTQPFSAKLIYDTIELLDLGMNSGANPLLLQKNESAFAFNATVRDGFITNRPAFSKKHLTINWPSAAVQTAFEQGLFQGGAYYQPDSGNQSLFAQIGGRQYQLLVNGNDITVTDWTLPADPNPATATQAWLWQAENYLIINDGLSLPLFWDGATMRRSKGPSVLLGTAIATVPPAQPVPEIGGTVILTLSAPYTGEFNVPILFNGHFYQPIENAAGYNVSAKNITDTPGTPLNVGDQVVIRNDVFGVVNSTFTPPSPGTFAANTLFYTVSFADPHRGTVGHFVIMFNATWVAQSVSGPNNVVFRNTQAVTISPTDTIAPGTLIPFLIPTGPNVVVGSIATAAVAPANGASVLLTLDTAFSGSANTIAFIGNREYTLTVIPPVAPGTALTVVNLTDTAGAAYSFNLDLLSVPELPAGRMGAYGLGQNAVALVDGLSFMASDISRGPSGTPANNYRDAVLKAVDNTFRGGNFAVPGAGNIITALIFTANLDQALGQGNLQVCTNSFMASCLWPIDFAALPTTVSPILTYSLIGKGPSGQNSTVLCNSDVLFRWTNGLGSLILGRRDFSGPGNTPISEEMKRVFRADDETLLAYGSAVVFDNRHLQTVSPQASSQGVLHAGLSVMNLDPVSGIRGKLPPVYDGLWTGLNTLQLVTGKFNGRERAFAFTFNVDLSKIELWEIFTSDSGENFDEGIVPIPWGFETPVIFGKDVKPRDVMVSLRDGELALADVKGPVRVSAYYRSDNFVTDPTESCWVPWHSFQICADKIGTPQYFPRLGLGEPTARKCDPILNTPMRDAYATQARFVITGHATFLRARFAAVTVPTPKFQKPICEIANA